jgi:hypothetical protein
MNDIDTTNHPGEMRTGRYINPLEAEERVPRRPLDEIASLVQGLTYGEMMELAECCGEFSRRDLLSRRKIYRGCCIVGQNPTRRRPMSWKSRPPE